MSRDCSDLIHWERDVHAKTQGRKRAKQMAAGRAVHGGHSSRQCSEGGRAVQAQRLRGGCCCQRDEKELSKHFKLEII